MREIYRMRERERERESEKMRESWRERVLVSKSLKLTVMCGKTLGLK